MTFGNAHIQTIKQLKSNLFQQQGILPNNFTKAITLDYLRAKVLVVFKDQHLRDFIN